MKDNKVLLAAACLTFMGISLMYKYRKTNKNKSKPKRIWARKWLQRRDEGKGVLNMLNSELLPEDPESYKNFLRMNNDTFEKLLVLIQNDIGKLDTYMRESVSARNRLEVTLRFLATGETFRSLMYSTRIHESTISKFVPEVCGAIYVHLLHYLKTPCTTKEWLDIAKDFEEMWQFPHCLGALDGKHIEFRAPISAGSYYYNYKHQHSIVLLAMADARYKFTYVNIGINGRISDGGVYRESGLRKSIVGNRLNFPPAEPLSGRQSSVPYVIVADDAFPLSNTLLKPYPKRDLPYDQRIFNYRLSRARRIIENTFGILTARFRVLLIPINLKPDKVEQITLACVVLHNYLATENWGPYTEIVKDTLPKSLVGITRQGGNKCNNESLKIRDEFKNYFCSAIGAVEWQNKAVLTNNM